MAFAETFKALSDPVRREILNLLKGGRLTAGEIAGLPAAAVRGRGALPAFAGDHGDTLGLFRQRKRLVIACRHCVRPAAVYFGTASRLLLRREP